MAKLVFQGHSDDTFGEYELTNDDYDCCASGALIVFQVKDADGNGLNVVGQYGGKQWPKDCPGCWFVGIQPMDEDVAIPNWPMSFELGDNGYSPALTIEAPDGVTVECLNRKK